MDKIIFLDFDGVLNSGDNSEVLSSLAIDSGPLRHRFYTGVVFDERCVRWLQWIVDKTNCKIVISSSWRLHYELGEMKRIWGELDLPGEIIDYTPFYNDLLVDDGGQIMRNFERGKEIQMWVDAYKPIRYCIVDDEYDILFEQCFVQTDPEFGLTSETSKLVVEYLNK